MINDGYGHGTGDEILQAVAGRLCEAVRPQDLVARWGGEEFLIIAHELTAPQLTALGERIRSIIARNPFATSSGILEVRASAGLALAEIHRNDVETLLAEADTALYSAKRRGRNQVQLAA